MNAPVLERHRRAACLALYKDDVELPEEAKDYIHGRRLPAHYQVVRVAQLAANHEFEERVRTAELINWATAEGEAEMCLIACVSSDALGAWKKSPVSTVRSLVAEGWK